MSVPHLNTHSAHKQFPRALLSQVYTFMRKIERDEMYKVHFYKWKTFPFLY